MCRKLCCVVIIVVSLISNDAFAFTEDPANASHNPKSFEARILAITDVVLQQHIDPPTRQEMILAGVKALYQADQQQIPKGLSQRISDLAKPSQFTNFLNSIHTDFSKQQNLEAILTKGILSSLPCGARLIDAGTNKIEGQIAANRYVGVGIALQKDKSGNFPVSVIYGGPAWKAGLKTRDLILKVDGNPIKSKELTYVIQKLRGEAGSKVTMVVRHPNSQDSRTLTMTRGRIFIPTVVGFQKISDEEWQYTLDWAKDIAYIRLKNIGPSTLHELRNLETKLRNKNINGIIIDLRTGGGILHDTILVADSLLDGGTIGYIQSLNSTQKHEARPGSLFQSIPMVVLVGKQTSSGNVFLTAALQDNKRAIIIGDPTSGQTYVRSIVALPDRNDKIVMATAFMQRSDGTTLLIPRSYSSPLMNMNVLNTSKQKKRPGYIIPDRPLLPTNVMSGETIHTKHPRKSLIITKAIKVLRNNESQVPSAPKKQRIKKTTSGS